MERGEAPLTEDPSAAGRACEPSSREHQTKQSPLTDPVWWFRGAVLVAVIPIMIVAIRNGMMGWYPAHDAALTTVHINDVFSAHPPLLGLPARYSVGYGFDFYYPGALEMYLLAVPVKLFGVSWGLVLGMGVLNTGWFVMAMWLIRRRVGYRAGLIACAFGASLLWGLGSQILLDPTPVRAAPIAFLAFCAAAWSVAEADSKALLPFAITTNFLLLAQLKFSLVVPAIGVFALAMWVVKLRRLRKVDAEGRTPERRRQKKWLIASIAFTIIVWIPPIIQQFAGTEGNLGNLLKALTHGSDTVRGRSLLNTIGAVSSPITTWPLWFRDSAAKPNFTDFVPTTPFILGAVGIAVVLALVIVVGRSARHRDDSAVLNGLIIGLIGWTILTASTMVSPYPLPYNQQYLDTLWPLSMFIWLILAFGVIRSGVLNRLFHNARSSTLAPLLLGTVTLIFAALTIPIANLDAVTAQRDIPVAHQVRRAIKENVGPGSPVLATVTNYESRTYFADSLLTLQELGIPFRVSPGWNTTLYGSYRTFHRNPLNAGRELTVSNSDIVPEHARQILAVLPPEMVESPKRYAEVSSIMNKWARANPTIRLNADSSVTLKQRRYVNTIFAKNLEIARYMGITIFDVPDFVAGMATTNVPEILEPFTTSGLSRAQIITWLKDRVQVRENGVYLYLGPIREGSGASDEG